MRNYYCVECVGRACKHLSSVKMKWRFVLLIIVVTVYFSYSPSLKLKQLDNLEGFSVLPIPDDERDPDPDLEAKREFIKGMMKDAWDDYVRYAWGANELQPVSQTWRYGNIYGSRNIGSTIIDALDSLYIMGLKEEFQQARDWVATSFDIRKSSWLPWRRMVSVFEINIRIVGGLLSAYALTGDPIFANKAYEVGQVLLPAFETDSGIPFNRINPSTGETDGSPDISLAALGSLHLEFVYLSKISNDPIFFEKVNRIRKNMKRVVKPRGLYPTKVSTRSGEFVSNYVTIGGGGDSFYEYLLKSWIQTGDLEGREMYDEAMDALVKHLMFHSKPSHLLYFGDIYGEDWTIETFSHLACFAGGMFALGAVTDPREDRSHSDQDMNIGKEMTRTCRQSYINTKTGIGPEDFYFNDKVEARGRSPPDMGYILRPEVIESYFILYRLTNDSKYQEWGWEAAQAIQKHCKVGPGRGYSGLVDVDSSDHPKHDDVQQTFFLAETLKYLYLLFSSPEVLDLKHWVFNTESHPLPIQGMHPMFPK